MSNLHKTIRELQTELTAGKITSVELTKQALKRIADPNNQGGVSFLSVYEEQALAAAAASDKLRAAGFVRSSLEGIPVSIKDLFDYAGDVTKGGSILLNDAPKATEHSLIVKRLVEKGAVIIGRTNMTEFAFSGLGLNPHYGTPLTFWEREKKRIAGGSSSGAAASVVDAMCGVAIGTDTGGSIRIPAAFCGLTGFKPTAARIPSKGVMPLSHSLDSSGPIGHTVECCAITDSILAAEPEPTLQVLKSNQLRFILPKNYVFDGADNTVITTFNAAIERLRSAGVQIIEQEIEEFNEIPHIFRLGGFVCADAWYYHKGSIEQHEDSYDPRVASRIKRGQSQSAVDYIELQFQRQDWIRRVERYFDQADAFILPTTPIIPPTVDELVDDATYFEKNMLILRNPTLFNFLDGCALTLPCSEEGKAPVGLMLGAAKWHDRKLLNIGYSIETLLKS
ncbi:amidase [Oligella urethralis]|uniref:amidase n=1 Tax=Oligella urethralis TaxID=90245 RepID=UPI00298D9F8E|nr:amidase [Oligella urethralis]